MRNFMWLWYCCLLTANCLAEQTTLWSQVHANSVLRDNNIYTYGEGAWPFGWRGLGAGVHPGFFNWGGGGSSISDTAATHVRRGGGGIMPVLTWLDQWGAGAFPSCTAHQIYYRKLEWMSEILGFVTYFRGRSRILQLGGGLNSKCMLDHLRCAIGTRTAL